MGPIDLIGPNDLVGPINLIGLNDLVVPIGMIGPNDLVGQRNLIGPNDLIGPIRSSLFVVPEDLSQQFDVPFFCEELDLKGVLLVRATLWSSCFARRYCVQTVCCVYNASNNAKCFLFCDDLAFRRSVALKQTKYRHF